MLELRYPWFWWAFGWLLIIGVTVGSLMPGSYLEFLSHFSIRDKALHALAYLVLMLWFAGLYPRDRHWIVAALIFTLGFAIDLAQGATPSRTFDLADVAANAGGILVGLVLAWFLFAGWCRRVEQLLFF
jgi:VanZ family protein